MNWLNVIKKTLGTIPTGDNGGKFEFPSDAFFKSLRDALIAAAALIGLALIDFAANLDLSNTSVAWLTPVIVMALAAARRYVINFQESQRQPQQMQVRQLSPHIRCAKSHGADDSSGSTDSGPGAWVDDSRPDGDDDGGF